MIRLLAGLLFLMPVLAWAGPVCVSGHPNTLPCLPAAANLQMDDVLWGTQATGPDRSNQTVKVTPAQIIGLDHAAAPVTVGSTTHSLADWLATLAPTGALATVATSGSASDLLTGTLPAGRLPTPGASALGGVKSSSAPSHQFATGIDTSGALTFTQPAAADVSGLATVATSGDVADLTNGTTGTGAVVRATSPTLATPNLGTPSAINLSNAMALPCPAMPALTGAVTTSAGSCATANAPGQKTKGVSWDSGTTVTAATTPLYSPTISGTIDSVTYYTNGSGSPSFAIAITINGTNVTSCNGLTVNSSSVTTTTCTGANTFAGGDKIAVVTSSISGTPQQALVQINYH